jgi:TonB family protein
VLTLSVWLANPIRGLCYIIEYYPDGKKKLFGRSKTIEPIQLEGTCLTFYKNGHRKTTGNYNEGLLVGGFDEYYPNGQLLARKEYILKDNVETKLHYKYKTSSFTVQQAFDSLGTVTVKDGNGIYSGYNEDPINNLKVTEEGPIKNGLRSGSWKGIDKDRDNSFEEVYENGELISGKAVRDGVTTTYSKSRIELPKFPGGEFDFNRYLARNIRYPAKDRENNIQGKVILSIVINKDGTVTDVKIIRSVSDGIDSEALRVLKNSPKWIPGTAYGSPAKIRYSVPINFALAYR